MTHPRAPLTLLLAAYLLITLGYGIVNPLFEAPDEHWHFFTAQYIVQHHKLPAVTQDYDKWMSQEAAQPPLYYLLGAVLIAPVDTAAARNQVWLNPFFLSSIGNASAVTNLNLVVHTPLEKWPWHGYVLAAHLLRILSTFLGLGTLLCIYGSGRLLWPADPRRALLATALVGFLPQFNFVHASISNDPLIIFLASAALYQLLRIVKMGVNHRRLIPLGVTIGLAALTKNAGILLLAYATGMLSLVALKERQYRTLPQIAAFVILPAVSIAGWLWWRNWTLYGDVTAANQFIRIAGGDRGYTLGQVLGETRSLLFSSVAVLGWFNVRAPAWVYWFWGGLAGLALVGACLKIATQWQAGAIRKDGAAGMLPAALLGGWFLLVYAGLILFMLRTPAAQGRLLFPALIPISLAATYGLTGCERHRILPHSGRMLLIPVLGGLATTVWVLFLVLPQIYAPPPTVEEIPAEATRVSQDMGQGLRLLAVQVETETAVPGQLVWITLYWQADTLPSAPPELVVEILGRSQALAGKLHAYHGRGLYPATLWPARRIIADRFGILLNRELAAPVLARTFVRIKDGGEAVVVGSVKVTPSRWPASSSKALARLGNGIELTAASLRTATAAPGDEVVVDVQWRATAAPHQAYTTLVHLGPASAPPLVTGDRPPLNGDYPTDVWEAGEVIEDQYVLSLPADLPPGRYPVWIGMYDPATIERLPLLVGNAPQPNNVFLVGWLSIEG
ncbi:MAG: glycosyltransferase family 39 protein [Anaerolineae bacterium]